MLAYRPKVAILNPAGHHVRFVHGALASALVERGIAKPSRADQRVRAVELTHPVAHHAERIGEPTGNAIGGTRFTRYAALDCNARVIEHHPRCMWLDY